MFDTYRWHGTVSGISLYLEYSKALTSMLLVRVWRPVFALRLAYYWLRLRIIFKSRRQKEIAVEKWFESLAPVGQNPLETVSTYKTWASEFFVAFGLLVMVLTSSSGIDDTDFYGHLSNSSYAKVHPSSG